MIKIEYPPYIPSIKKQQEKEFIFDSLRKSWVLLTPEEWVRQNFLHYLVEVMNYPASLIAVEKQVVLAEVKKRFDIVVYNRKMEPFMVVECKEMNVPLTEVVWEQALRYNSSLGAGYIVLTNGSYCMAFKKKSGTYIEVYEMPGY